MEKIMKKRLERQRTVEALEKNWAKLLKVGDGLSAMPKKWKSAILPKEDVEGAELHKKFKDISNEIEILVNRRVCFRTQKQQRAQETALSDHIKNFIDTKVAVFFARRNKMYIDHLCGIFQDGLEDGATRKSSMWKSFQMQKQFTKIVERSVQLSKQTIEAKKSSKITPCTQLEKESSESAAFSKVVPGRPANIVSALLENESKQSRESEESLDSPGHTIVKWPENTTRLFRQVMRLIRNLDGLFARSYNQTFELRVVDNGLVDWTRWVTNATPKNAILAQNTSDLFTLYCQAARSLSDYDKLFSRLAQKTNGEWHLGNLKSIFRILEKAKLLQHGDFDCSKIFDIVRGKIVYDTMLDVPGGLMYGVRTLCTSQGFQVIRIKDRFNQPTSGCWRDVLVNGRMISPGGIIQSHIVEVQFHLKALGEERQKVGGHYIYERQRALLEACELVAGDEALEILRTLHEHRAAEHARPNGRLTLSRDSLTAVVDSSV